MIEDRKDENNPNMYLNFEVWQDIETYLLIERKLSPSRVNLQNLRSRYKILCAYYNSIPFNRVNFNHFLQEMRDKGYTNAYLNQFIKFAKHLDRFLKLNQLQDFTQFKEKRQKLVDILTPDEIKSIAEYEFPYRYTPELVNLKYKCLYYLLGTTGCRIGEAIGLTWNNYHGEYALMENTKNGDDRIVPIPRFLQQLIDTLPRDGDTVFNIKDDTTVNRDLKIRAKELGITKTPLSCHTFRHSFISTMIKTSEASLVQVAKIVGHRDLSTTSNVYTHLLIEDLKLTQMLHPLCQKEQTVGDITSSLKRLLDRVVDKSKYTLTLSEDNDTVELQIKKA